MGAGGRVVMDWSTLLLLAFLIVLLVWWLTRPFHWRF